MAVEEGAALPPEEKLLGFLERLALDLHRCVWRDTSAYMTLYEESV